MEHSYLFNEAIAYVKNNVSKERVQYVKQRLTTTNQNDSVDDVDEELHDEIYDLMEEFGDDNGLSEGWWLCEGDINGILWLL